MELLISFYDNALIYYSNIFFATLFLIGILGIFLTMKGIVYLNREFRKIFSDIKNGISKIRINQIGIKKIKIDKNLSSANVIKQFLIEKFIKSFKDVLKIIKIIFIRINAGFEYLQLKVEKIFKKIGKEIFIEE
ncbi:MAG: hypothetical protein AAB600_00770 [Patescibacteria group bacterium]